MLALSLLSSLLPVGLLSISFVFAPLNRITNEGQLSRQATVETKNLISNTTSTRAEAIDARLGRIGYTVQLLRAYAEKVLSAPGVFAAQVAPGLTANDPAEAGDAAEGSPGQVTHPAPLGNPLFYTKGEDGAIRKLINDDRPAVYFAARAGGEFSLYDMQRLHATTMLDSLLIEPATTDSLCTQTFLITRDSLLRTYPFRDFSLWPPDKDLSKPRDYWNAAKADENGLIWTTPYISALTQDWVIACISAAMAGDRVIAVVGCEISVSIFSQELLGFPSSTSDFSWVIKPIFSEGDAPQQWIVLATQPEGGKQLGVFPLDAASLPDDKHTGTDILEAADLLAHGNDELLSLVEHNIDAHATNFDELMTEISVTRGNDGRFLANAPIVNGGWFLCSISTSPALESLEQFESTNRSWLQQRLMLAVLILLFAVVLAFAMAWLEARKIVHPLSILAEQVHHAALTRRTSSVMLADEGEVGVLAHAVQELIDATTDRNGTEASPPPAPAGDDE